jgi:PTH2 family peptidyl-tRNA hydrolase
MYIIVNSELGMGKGKIASQVGHAVQQLVEELVRSEYVYNPKITRADQENYRKWKDGGTAKIVLKASEEHLRRLAADPTSCAIYDAGKTQIASGSLTVVGFLPRLDRKDFSGLALL